jgi:hypothetical protein
MTTSDQDDGDRRRKGGLPFTAFVSMCPWNKTECRIHVSAAYHLQEAATEMDAEYWIPIGGKREIDVHMLFVQSNCSMAIPSLHHRRTCQ